MRYIGSTDTPLTPAGKEQARRLAVRLKRMPIDRMLTSPSQRALDTAGPTAQGTGLSLTMDEDLKEIDFGQWEGLSFGEIEQKDPDMVAEWARGGMDFCFPGGECLAAFWERVCRAGERLRVFPEESIFVVTHGGVIRFMLCHFLKLPARSHFMFEINRGSISRLNLDEGHAVLSGLNDCSHLEDT